MISPSPEQRQDFLRKVMPIALRLSAAPEWNESGKPIDDTRALNLSMGLTPRTKKERAFQQAIAREIWRAYPNDLFPEMAMKPEPVEPDLRVVR